MISRRSDREITDDWVIDEIFHHYGAKVAMYFAFTDFYSKRLHILMCLPLSDNAHR
jgi:hypothetical protein